MFTIESAKAAITGKASTKKELLEQVEALNYLHGEVSEREMDTYTRDVNKAAAELSDTWHNERVNELIAMGNNAAMWKEFLAHRTCKRVRVILSKKTNHYECKVDDKGRVNYPELDKAYIKAETKRLELEGKTAEVDLDALTIAHDRRFNTFAPLFFRDAYARFIGDSLDSFNSTTRKGKHVDVKAPSVRQLTNDLNTLVKMLLPEDMAPPLRKAELRTLSTAISGATQTELKRKGESFCLNWLLNVIQERIENRPVDVIMGEKGIDSMEDIETIRATYENADNAKAESAE